VPSTADLEEKLLIFRKKRRKYKRLLKARETRFEEGGCQKDVKTFCQLCHGVLEAS